MKTNLTTLNNASVRRESSAFKYPNPKAGTTTSLASAPVTVKKAKLSLKPVQSKRKKSA